MATVKAIPAGFNSVSAYLVVPNSVKAIDFYSKAFGAELVTRMPGPDGQSTMHAEIRIGNSIVMMSDENPNYGTKTPATLGGTPVTLHVYCENADALFDRAIAAGCKAEFPVADMFWGDRYGKLTDPYGHRWGIATHKEDVSPEECTKRAAAWFASMSGGKPGGK